MHRWGPTGPAPNQGVRGRLGTGLGAGQLAVTVHTIVTGHSGPSAIQVTRLLYIY